MPWKDKVVTVKIHKEVHDLLVMNKEKNGVSITFAIEQAVQQYFDRKEKKDD